MTCIGALGTCSGLCLRLTSLIITDRRRPSVSVVPYSLPNIFLNCRSMSPRFTLQTRSCLPIAAIFGNIELPAVCHDAARISPQIFPREQRMASSTRQLLVLRFKPFLSRESLWCCRSLLFFLNGEYALMRDKHQDANSICHKRGCRYVCEYARNPSRNYLVHITLL